jgi:hypothetical protein
MKMESNSLITTPQLKNDKIKVYIEDMYDIKRKVLKIIKEDKVESYIKDYIYSSKFERDNLKLYNYNYSKTKSILKLVSNNKLYKIKRAYYFEPGNVFKKFLTLKTEIIKIKIPKCKISFEVEVKYYLVKKSLLSLLEQYGDRYLILSSEFDHTSDNNYSFKFKRNEKNITVDSDIKKKKIINNLKYIINELNNSEDAIGLDEYIDNWAHRLLYGEMK